MKATDSESSDRRTEESSRLRQDLNSPSRPPLGFSPFTFGMQLMIEFAACAGGGYWLGRRWGHPRGGILAGLLLAVLLTVYEIWKLTRMPPGSGDSSPKDSPPTSASD